MTDTADDAQDDAQDDGLGPVLEDLAETGVHVDDSAADWLDADELAELEANVAASADPVFVVLTAPPDDARNDAGDDLAFRLHDAGGEDGLYVGVNSVPAVEDGSYFWSVQQWGDVAGEADVTNDVSLYLEYGDDGDGFEPAEGLLGLTGHLADDTFAEVVAQGSDGLSTAADRSGAGDDGGGAGPWLVAALVVAVLAGVAYAGYRAAGRRTTPAAAAQERGFTLPGSVLDRVREAGDAEAGRRARAAVLALGEAIDATELDDGAVSPTTTEAWQTALDHYDAASRLVPADGSGREDAGLLDVVGALVLAERGSVALDAARRGTRPDLGRHCFLNPLHGAAEADGNPIEVQDRRIDAPLCRDCAADLRAGRRPDVLDVLDGQGRPVHYFETDAEPWASTGFGSLSPDLLARLHGTVR